MYDHQGRPSNQDHGQDLENVDSHHSQDNRGHENDSDSLPGSFVASSMNLPSHGPRTRYMMHIYDMGYI
jgi:hypothetical protein